MELKTAESLITEMVEHTTPHGVRASGEISYSWVVGIYYVFCKEYDFPSGVF